MIGKESLECRRMHIWALKTLATHGLLCSHDSALLHWQLLDFHFQKVRLFCHGNIYILSCIYINYKRKILNKMYQEKWENAYFHAYSGALRCRQISEKFAGPCIPPECLEMLMCDNCRWHNILGDHHQRYGMWYSDVSVLRFRLKRFRWVWSTVTGSWRLWVTRVNRISWFVVEKELR